MARIRSLKVSNPWKLVHRMTVIVLTLLVCSWILADTARSHPLVTVVMSGLDNPRGLAFGPEGGLYVVEAGRGGTATCTVMKGRTICYGATGALTRRWRGSQQRVATGLPSYINPVGEVTGAHDVSFQGRGAAFVTTGWGGDPAARAGFGTAGALFGSLLRVAAEGRSRDFDDDDAGLFGLNWPHGKKSRSWRAIADVSAYEAFVNPDRGAIDTNPYGLHTEKGAHVVADAGANALLQVNARGEVSTLAVFPSRPARSTDAVPTSVVVGPDGAYYVGELTGAPFTEGEASVYRLVPCLAPEVIAAGFKTIIDIDFGPDGSLYVLQYATGPTFFSGPGQVVRVMPDGARSTVVEGLSFPTSLLVDGDGTVYVSNRGTSIGTGEVLRID